MKHTVLCVDDEVDNVEALERQFRRKYRVLKATSGTEALDILAQENVTVLISDQRMPHMTGVEFFEKSMISHPDAVRILLTGYTDIESVIAAVNSGQIYRYVTKPWDPRELLSAVDRAVERFELNGILREKNEQLQIALDELRTLDQAKNQFMVVVNHELKTPLTSITSYLELLRESNLNEEQTLFVQRIQKGTDRLNEIVHDVVELVSAQTGQLPIHKTFQPLSEMVPPLPAEMQKEVEKKGLELNIEIPSTKAHFDRQIMQKTMLRIIHNAIKFSDENSAIEVGGIKNKKEIEIFIQNQGHDLSSTEIRQILKPFALNENIMNHSQGLGLGLSLCQALMAHHGSQLQIVSKDRAVRISITLFNKK